jgi:hypothetical protein
MQLSGERGGIEPNSNAELWRYYGVVGPGLLPMLPEMGR